MSLTLASYPSDQITKLRAVSGFIDDMKQKLIQFDSSNGKDEGIALRRKLHGHFQEFASKEEEFKRDIESYAEVIRKSDIHQIETVLAKARRGAFDHYALIKSPLCVLNLMTRLKEAVLERIGMEIFGNDNKDWCILVSGSLSRNETACCTPIDAYMVCQSNTLLAERFPSLIVESGLDLNSSENEAGVLTFQGVDEFEDMIASLTSSSSLKCASFADIRHSCGSRVISEQCGKILSNALKRWRNSSGFHLAARHIGAMKLALGFFGGFRVEKSGTNRGAFDIDNEAIMPIAANIRILSIAAGIDVCSTLDRIRALVAKRWLNIEPAEKIIEALHSLYSIRGSICGGDKCAAAEHRFVHPDELSTRDQDLLRMALETAASLERLTIQLIVGFH